VPGRSATVGAERRRRSAEIPKAGGLGGQIVQLLDYRGLLKRSRRPAATPARLRDSPSAVCISTSRSSRSPNAAVAPPFNRNSSACSRNSHDERGAEFAADTRSSVKQDQAAVTADVRGPDGPVSADRAIPRGVRRRVHAGSATCRIRSLASPIQR